MERNIPARFRSTVNPLRTALIFSISILVFWAITINRSPNLLRPLSMLFRTGYTLIIPILFVALYLAFRLRGWTGYFLSLLLTLSMFALALSGAWASGKTESGLLSGVIPMFDSANYYLDALRLMAGAKFSIVSTRRPLFIAFFTFLLWITKHNLLYALALMTLLVALACYLLAREILKTHGPAIAVFVLMFVFVYYRYHSGVVRTENLGILLGVLGTAFIWRSISRGQHFYLIAGVFLTSLGIIARAGAFFILPLLVLWGAILFKHRNGTKISWQMLLGGILAVVAAFSINGLITKAFGTRDVVPFGNFSYSFYGLASGGKSWAYVLEAYPNADVREIYRMAFRLILSRPDLFAKGIAYNYSMFFSNTNYGLFSYMGGEGQASSTISYWGLWMLSALGVWNWIRHRNDPFLGFIMVSAIGLLLSVPFLPPTDTFRLRSYATSVVILALLPAMGLQGILTSLKLNQINRNEGSQRNEVALAIFASLLVVSVVIGPFLARGVDTLPRLDLSGCESNHASILVRYEPSAAVHFVSQTTTLLDWTPTFHIGTLHNSVHDFPNFDFMDWALASVRPNGSLFYALDYLSDRGALVWIDSASLPSGPAFLGICGAWDENPALTQFNIFYATSINSLDPQ